MMGRLKALVMRDPAAAIAAVSEPLGELRARLEALREQRAIVEAAPRPQAEAEAAIDQFVALAAGKVEVPAGHLAARPTGYIDAFHLLERDQRATGIALLCAIAPDQVKGWLLGALRDRYATLPAPMSAEERQAELARLDAEIAGVERREIDLCWSLFDAGVQVDWRPDASVELVLGLDAAAPEPAP